MLIQFLVLLLVAGVCGALGQAITGYSHGGCLVSIALGFWDCSCARPTEKVATTRNRAIRNFDIIL